MYDASLDKIYRSDWNKTINYPGVYHRPAYSYGFNQSQSIMLYPDNYYDRFYPDSYKSYRNINWFGFSVYDQYYASDIVLRSSMDDGAMYKKGRVSGAGVPESEPMEAENMPPPPKKTEEQNNLISLLMQWK